MYLITNITASPENIDLKRIAPIIENFEIIFQNQLIKNLQITDNSINFATTLVL